MKTTTLFIVAASALCLASCSSQNPTKMQTASQLETKADPKGKTITLTAKQGAEFKHPLIAIWIENENGAFIQTLYASASFVKGIFPYGVMENGKWIKAARRHPSALPYFSHKFGNKTTDGLFLPTPENPVPDAVSGATPTGSFTLKAKSAIKLKHYKILMEINEPFDFNSSWNSDKYPGDEEYKLSGQPALVYAVDIDTDNPSKEFTLKPIGLSSYNGSDGVLNPDTASLTTALMMLNEVKVIIE